VTSRPFEAIAGGVRLAVRLTPRASGDGVEGVTTGTDGRAALRVRLAAPPVDGAANEALIAYLAERLGLRKAAIAIRSGHAARHKVLLLRGDPAVLLERLEALLP
jgi:uncharacterized protein (TIGR00251 family)